MKLEHYICEHCLYGKEEIVTAIKPLFAGSYSTHKVQRLQQWCSKHYQFKLKCVKECSEYRPKAGKIDKNITQKTLF